MSYVLKKQRQRNHDQKNIQTAILNPHPNGAHARRKLIDEGTHRNIVRRELMVMGLLFACLPALVDGFMAVGRWLEIYRCNALVGVQLRLITSRLE
jgi:hypothetical protein